MKRTVAWLLGLGLLLLWWFVAVDWLDRPGTERLSTFYIALVIVAGVWHGMALRKFWAMAQRVKVAEARGLLEPGASLFAYNQRFRYSVRMGESLMALAVGVTGYAAAHHPGVVTNPWYLRLILTYFVGSVAATGYLTYRDVRVVRKVSKQNAVLEGADDV